MRTALSRLYVLCLFAALTVAAGCRRIEQRIDELRDERRQEFEERIERLLPFGNPSNASTGDPNNYLLLKRTFAISYSNTRGTANWVAWRTTIGDLGETLERPQFEPDPTLPLGFTLIRPMDYSGSGYDRGHLLPSADRFGDPEANAETFLMTNIIPQAGDLNQYPWQKLESYARGIVRRGSDVYTIAGVYGEKGVLRGRVKVPTNCWKIIILLPPGGTTGDIHGQTRVISVDMPNEDGIARDWWQKYLTNVRAIEQKTGYNFLSALPAELQEALETQIDESSSIKRK